MDHKFCSERSRSGVVHWGASLANNEGCFVFPYTFVRWYIWLSIQGEAWARVAPSAVTAAAFAVHYVMHES